MEQTPPAAPASPAEGKPLLAIAGIVIALGMGVVIVILSSFEIYLLAEHLSPKKWMIVPLWLVPGLALGSGLAAAAAGGVSALQRKGSKVIPIIAVVLGVMVAGASVVNLVLRAMLHR